MADEEKAETQHEFDSTMYGIHAIGHLSSVIRRPSSVIRRLFPSSFRIADLLIFLPSCSSNLLSFRRLSFCRL
jgi:hypothetical protein